jgi:prolyl-tRNA synthetase
MLASLSRPASVKFNDADLIGNPIRLSVSKRTLAGGEAELRLRSETESTLIPLADVVGKVEAIASELFSALSPDRV